MPPPTQRRFILWFAATSRFALALGVAVAGIGLSMTAVLVTRDWSNREIAQRVERTVADRCAALKEKVRDIEPILGMLRDLHIRGGEPSPTQFQTIAASFLSHHTGILSIQYAPRIPHAGRVAAENTQRARGAAGFRIWQPGAGQTSVVAEQRDEYYPITLCQPLPRFEKLLGCNLTAIPDLQQAAQRACDSGLTAASPVASGLLGTESQREFLVFLAVYRNGGTPPTADLRRERVIGYYVATVRVRTLMESAFADLESPGMRTWVFDVALPAETALVYAAGGPPTENEAPQELAGYRRQTPQYFHQQTFDFGGRRWGVACLPSAQWLARHQFWSPWLVLASGLLFAGLAGVYALRLLTEATSVERTVKQRTEQLRESEARFRAIAEYAHDVETWHNPEGRLLWINRAVERLHGYTPDECLRMAEYPLDLVHHEDRAWVAQTFRAAVKNLTAANDLVFRLVCKNGTVSWASVSWLPIYGEDRANLGLRMAIRDVTQRKQAEEKLRELSLAVEQSPAAVMITDPQGIIEYVNPRFTAITGYTAEEALGRNPRFLKSHQHSATFYAGLWQTISGGGAWNGEFCNCRKNGELYWEATSISPIRDESGQITHFVAVKEDVSDRKRAEEILRLNEFRLETRVRERTAELALINTELEAAKAAAEAASRAKSAFLANMSHEIRTPMMAILGFTELLTHRNISKEKHRKYLEAIQRNGRSLQQLIKDILDFSKIEAGKMTVEQIAYSPWQLLEEVLSLTRLRARRKRLELRVHYEYPLPAAIQTDPLRLRQILVNLVGNAIKFTEHGGVQVAVSLAPHAEGGPRLLFAVKDTGIGIGAEGLPLLFQPLTQGDSSMTRRFGGTGLGLAISKQLARMLGGDIEVSSELGRGSTFILTVSTGDLTGVEMLAAAPDLSRRQLPSPEEWENSLRGNVLLAEDAPDSQELLRTILEQFGLTVELANNGAVALEKALSALTEQRPYDLVLMDIQMPEIDGYEVTRRLRQAGWQGRIVALTAHGTSEDRQRCLEAGCSDYLSKPIAQRSLYAKLQAFLPHHEGASKPPPRLRSEGGLLDAPGIGAAEKARLIDLFRENLRSESQRLECGLGELSPALLAESAHRIAGAAGMFGFLSLSEAARALEDAVRAGVDFAQLQAPVAHLLAMAEATIGHATEAGRPISGE